MVREEIYDGMVGNPTLSQYIIYSYTNDNLTKEEMFLENPKSLFRTTNYEYDEHNNLIRKYITPTYNKYDDIKYAYNDKNKLKLEEYASSDPNDYKYIKYIYDEKDRKIKTEYYDLNWSLILYLEETYEGNSPNPSESVQINSDNTERIKYNHYYDSWGNLTKTIINDNCAQYINKFKGELLIESISFDLVWGCTEAGMTKFEYDKIH